LLIDDGIFFFYYINIAKHYILCNSQGVDLKRRHEQYFPFLFMDFYGQGRLCIYVKGGKDKFLTLEEKWIMA